MLRPPLAALAIAPSKAEELLFHVGKQSWKCLAKMQTVTMTLGQLSCMFEGKT